ncbi:hypothetical protein F8388_026280 [Cannabis sativa]|uniref:S-protein homolog n=1 Tax=Cannabis sativa TaxID=3483 RepID=A0A7J6EZ22_CANSA|nr:hypothetical protein F8388_026280 [Cannabis sativa]
MEKALICSVLLMMMVNMISSSSSSIVLSNNNYDEKIGGVFVYKTTFIASLPMMIWELMLWPTMENTSTTLYNCGLTWIGATGSFDLFKASRDSLRCANTCVWRAHNDGVYGFKEDSTKPDIIYKWA